MRFVIALIAALSPLAAFIAPAQANCGDVVCYTDSGGTVHCHTQSGPNCN